MYRVDAEGVLFVHPQISKGLCELLKVPALENAIRETLDTSQELVPAAEIQVCCKQYLPTSRGH